MQRLLKASSVTGIGLCLIVIGFVYDIMFAGIPYQDPTPELLAQWEFHSSIAKIFYASGALVFIIGLFVMPIIWRWQGKAKRS